MTLLKKYPYCLDYGILNQVDFFRIGIQLQEVKSLTAYNNKIAVITGAAAGIGKAIAEKCLNQKMSVVLADVDKTKLESCEKEFKNIKNSQVLSVLTDISQEDQVTHLAEKTLTEFGKVNFLFNNAGIAGPLGPLWTQTTANIEKVLRVNLLGTIHGIKAFVPAMLKQTDQCYIINTSAGAGLLTGAGLSAYKASKHAITALTEVLAADLEKISTNIHVSLLIPHWINTDLPLSIEEASPNTIQTQLENLRKFGMQPSQVAECVFAGLRNKQFYIFTHPDEHLPKIKQRMERILSEV